jgi:hypothetical protein
MTVKHKNFGTFALLCFPEIYGRVIYRTDKSSVSSRHSKISGHRTHRNTEYHGNRSNHINNINGDLSNENNHKCTPVFM